VRDAGHGTGRYAVLPDSGSPTRPALLEQEHETRLVDAPAWDWETKDVIADIDRFEPDLLVIDSSFPSLNNDDQCWKGHKGMHTPL